MKGLILNFVKLKADLSRSATITFSVNRSLNDLNSLHARCYTRSLIRESRRKPLPGDHISGRVACESLEIQRSYSACESVAIQGPVDEFPIRKTQDID